MTNAILEDRLFFGEVVGVDAFNFVTGFEGDAEAVVDHEGGKFLLVQSGALHASGVKNADNFDALLRRREVEQCLTERDRPWRSGERSGE